MKKKINEVIILFCGQKARVKCDRKCNKAWGINTRPKKQLSIDEDDYCFLSDNELKNAPTDPGTYEFNDCKPQSPNDFPNKWCVRECERCSMSRPGKITEELPVIDYEKRFYNMRKK